MQQQSRGFGRPRGAGPRGPGIGSRAAYESDGYDPREGLTPQERAHQIEMERAARQGVDNRGMSDYQEGRESRYGARSERYGHRAGVVGSFNPTPFNDGKTNTRIPYNYQSGKNRSGIQKSYLHAFDDKEMTQEAIWAESYEKADLTVSHIYHHLINRSGPIGRVIEEAIDRFAYPFDTKQPDPVFSEFISDLRMNGDVYAYNVAQYISMALVYFTAQEIYHVDKPLPADKFRYLLGNITCYVLLLEFGNWASDLEDGWSVAHRLSNAAYRKLEVRDNIVDEYVGIINNVLKGMGAGLMNSPWEKSLIERLDSRRPSRSPSYDTYIENMQYDFHDIRTPQVKSNPDGIRANRNHDDGFDHIMYEETMAYLNLKGRSVVAEYEKTNPTRPAGHVYNDNWEDYFPTDEERPKAPEPKKPIVTLDNFHEYDLSEVDYTQWFKLVPGTQSTYVIRPDDLATVSRVLTNKGKNEDYWNWGHRKAFRMPVVQLDWASGTYDYVLIPIKNRKEIEMILTNPELAIPKLDLRTDEEEDLDYLADTATLAELEEKRKKAENDPNIIKILHTKPQVIYANKDYVFESRKQLTPTLDALNKTAEDKLGKVADAVVLPFSDYFEIGFNGLNMEQITDEFPYLVNGADFDYTFEALINKLNNTFRRKRENGDNWPMWEGVRNAINTHLCTVINRWLVEQRYYGATRKDNNFLAITNVLRSGMSLLEELKENDIPSYRDLFAFHRNKFLVERVQLFGSQEDLEYHADRATRDVDLEFHESARQTILDNMSLIIAKGSLVLINRADCPDTTKPTTLERSSNPEILHILDTVPVKTAKHFGREVPVYVIFGNDMNKTIWSVTRSGFDTNKVTLTPIDNYQSIAGQRTTVSEISSEPK